MLDAMVAAAHSARRGELIEIHGRATRTHETTEAGSGPTTGHAAKAETRIMAAVRSFAHGHAGFAYTTDVTATGLHRALYAARATRIVPQPPPPPGPGFADDGRWEDRSQVGTDLAQVWTSTTGPPTQLVLRRSRTTVYHVRSDTAATNYSEGSSLAVVRAGPLVDVAWSRHLRPGDLQDLRDRVSAVGQARPWSIRRQPVLFRGTAGAAVTAALTRALTGSPSTVAARVAAKLSGSLRLIDDATDPAGPAAGPFDAEGWPTAPRVLAADGELVIESELWGGPARSARTRGLARRPDLAQPPELAPSNVTLTGCSSTLAIHHGDHDLVAEISRGFACDAVNVGALSLEPATATFAVPCSGRLVRAGELTTRMVRGVLQGTVEGLVAGITALRPHTQFLSLDCGFRHADVLVTDGIALRAQ